MYNVTHMKAGNSMSYRPNNDVRKVIAVHVAKINRVDVTYPITEIL